MASVGAAQRLSVTHEKTPSSIRKEEGFVGVERHGIGAVDAAHGLTPPLCEHEKPAVGGVHVEPQSVFLCDIRERFKIVHGSGVDGPGVSDD